MIAFIYFLLLSSSWASDLGPCGHLVTARQTQDHTDGLIALLEDLLERQILGATQLNRLVDSLQRNELANPILESETWTSSSALIQYHAIQKYLTRGQLEQSRILDWAIDTLKEIGQTRGLKKEVREKTRTPIYQMEFNPVKGKPFDMGINAINWRYLDHGVKDSKPVNLTHTFELTSTHVTQSMWASIMGDVPSLEGTRSYSEEEIAVEINGKRIHIRPNHPVSDVSWLSAVDYANRLSILKGLKPAYDLSDVVYEDGTSVEKGNLRIKSGKIKINAPNEDIYQAEGYRLPTEAEFAFVLQLGGPADKTYPFGNDPSELANYEWHFQNSHGRLHAVAELLPYTLNGHSFYDLAGNMSIWMHDFGPQTEVQNHVSRGQTYFCSFYQFNSYLRSDMDQLLATRGLRLARTIKYTSPPQPPEPPRPANSFFKQVIEGPLK